MDTATTPGFDAKAGTTDVDAQSDATTKSSHVIVEAIFEDGSSFAHTYRFARDENEAMQATWQEARLTSKPVRTVHVMAVRRG